MAHVITLDWPSVRFGTCRTWTEPGPDLRFGSQVRRAAGPEPQPEFRFTPHAGPEPVVPNPDLTLSTTKSEAIRSRNQIWESGTTVITISEIHESLQISIK